MELQVISIIVGFCVTIGGIGVWAVRTEGRVNTHDTIFQEREKQDLLRERILTERLGRIETQMTRFEVKLDSYFNVQHYANTGNKNS
jgi:hypothetical protein